MTDITNYDEEDCQKLTSYIQLIAEFQLKLNASNHQSHSSNPMLKQPMICDVQLAGQLYKQNDR